MPACSCSIRRSRWRAEWNRALPPVVCLRLSATGIAISRRRSADTIPRADGSNPAGPIVPAKVRNLFPEINDGTPAASAMSVAKVDRSAASTSGCFAVLDQLVISDRFKALLDPRSLDSGQVAARLIAGPRGASDHCALETVLRMKR